MKTYIKEILDIRKNLDNTLYQMYSEQICEKIRSIKEYQTAKNVLFFYPYQKEADILPLAKECLSLGKNVYFPLVTSHTTMEFYKITSLDEFVPGYKGILEPKRTVPFIKEQKAETSCMIVPGSVFDKEGNRCGYGKGYYDRYLSDCFHSITTIGIGFSFQRIDKIKEVKQTDIPMDYIVNEKEVFRSKKMDRLLEIGQCAKKAKYDVQKYTTEQKNAALVCIADTFLSQQDELLAANQKDIAAAKENGISDGMIDRLTLNPDRISAMATGLKQIAALPDYVGEIIEEFSHLNGMKIKKVRVPLGVIGIIFESRPNVTADAFGLCFKSGNAVILKGGKEAIHSNIAITKVIRQVLKEQNMNEDAIMLIEDTDREVTSRFMKLKEYVDVLIPRGGAGLIKAVVENSTIPVIETGTGNCHIYVDKDANLTKAVRIIDNAKTQRISVCNACESLVVHKEVVSKLMPMLKTALEHAFVEYRCDEESFSYTEGAVLANEQDFGTEYLDYILSVKTVESVEEAVLHINRYNTGHSDAIITENKESAEYFLNNVDSACVYVNASTRFTDGFEFGFGAEIGISTQKLHARGPMGLKELTTYKYQITGNGEIRG